MKKKIKKFWKVTTEDGKMLLVQSPKPPKYATRWVGEATQIRPTGRSMMGFREVEDRPDLPKIPYTGHALYERRKDAKAAADNCRASISACGLVIDNMLSYVPIKDRSVVSVNAEEIDKTKYLALKKMIERERASITRKTHGIPPTILDKVATKADVEQRLVWAGKATA